MAVSSRLWIIPLIPAPLGLPMANLSKLTLKQPIGGASVRPPEGLILTLISRVTSSNLQSTHQLNFFKTDSTLERNRWLYLSLQSSFGEPPFFFPQKHLIFLLFQIDYTETRKVGIHGSLPVPLSSQKANTNLFQKTPRYTPNQEWSLTNLLWSCDNWEEGDWHYPCNHGLKGNHWRYLFSYHADDPL